MTSNQVKEAARRYADMECNVNKRPPIQKGICEGDFINGVGWYHEQMGKDLSEFAEFCSTDYTYDVELECWFKLDELTTDEPEKQYSTSDLREDWEIATGRRNP